MAKRSPTDICKVRTVASTILRDYEQLMVRHHPYIVDKSISGPRAKSIKDDIDERFVGWFELVDLLGEIQLLASPEVAELAEQVASDVLELSLALVPAMQLDHNPILRRTAMRVAQLRNAMRRELGVAGTLVSSISQWPGSPDPDTRGLANPDIPSSDAGKTA